MNKINTILLFYGLTILLTSCGNWLDVVPEGVPTIEMAFNTRDETFKYLGTCYSYIPPRTEIYPDNPAILGGDELWTYEATDLRFRLDAFNIARGLQNATEPLNSFWGRGYQALRDCNIFLENIDNVPDVPAWERDQWKAEVMVLKAYYHFILTQMYGPVPLIRKNIPVDSDISKVKIMREPVDDCFQYIVELLDEACTGDILPPYTSNPDELGRITKPIAMALKAKVLVTAASPLFNGNEQMSTLRNPAPDNRKLFNTTYDPDKWEKAVDACKEAILSCHNAEIELYRFRGLAQFTTATIAVQMDLRNAITDRWNCEIIWGNAVNNFGLYWQNCTMAKLNEAVRDYPGAEKAIMVPLKIATMFYTSNGVPLDEDKTRSIEDIYKLRKAQSNEKLFVKTGHETVNMHFDREPRFYAWIGFDGGVWYGQGRYNDLQELWTLYTKFGDLDGAYVESTGYLPKKYIPYTTVINSAVGSSLPSGLSYPWPIMRLSDLYLLYAEAINEAEGPLGPRNSEMFEYIDRVRSRAGLQTVKYSWNTYANSQKYNTQIGMRDIIRKERMIELVFEGHRFWDIRRWKIAPDLYRTPIEGWSYKEYETANYYRSMVFFNQKFGIRDYFWPIQNSEILKNPNLVQNIGW